jgi:hypothetical protein
LSKIKCFDCHKCGHYASRCPEEKKGKGKEQQMQVAASAKTQMNEFVAEFEKDFLLVSFLFTNMILRNAWYVDNGASQHMTLAQQLFSSLKKQDSRVQVELGKDAKYPVARVGTIPFQLESGNSLEFDDVLLIPGPKKFSFSFGYGR